MRLHLNWSPFLRHQWDFFRFDPVERLEIGALLGGWGSGKSHGVMRKALKIACANPWRDEYGNSNPVGVIEAPTLKVLKQSTMMHFDSIVPKECILKRRGPPNNDILMANGFRWLLHSGEGEMEGITACAYVIDEIHHPIYSSNPRRFLNAMARLRDPFSKRMAMLCAGLPESGWVRDTFDQSGPNRTTVLAGTKANRHIPTETLQAFFSACPSGFEETLLGGRWMAPQGAIYPQFSADLHLTDNPGRKDVPTHIAMDIGNYGAIVFGQEVPVRTRNIVGQEVPDTGLLIVDQVLTSDESVDQMCYRIKTQKDWFIHPNKSVFCVDPTIRRDELLAIRRHFPGCRVIHRDRGEELYPVESGIRQVQRALRDALGNVRLQINRRLANTQLGIVDFLQRYRRNESTQEPIKDNLRDHVGDALRYMVCELVRTEKPKALVF